MCKGRTTAEWSRMPAETRKYLRKGVYICRKCKQKLAHDKCEEILRRKNGKK